MVKYDTSKFHGVFVALNASYDANGELNTEKLKELALWYHSLGVKGLYVCGSTGEGMLLTAEERKASVKAVCEAVGGKLVILCHVGAPSTRQAVELAKHAESCGVDAVSAVPCVFYIHSEDAIANHWNTITEAVDLPFFIYNIPQLTGYNLSRGLFERMLQNEKIAGIKNSNEVAHQIMQFKALGGENFIVLNGPDEQYLAGRLMGADGGIGGTYGPMPELYMKLEEYICACEIEKARRLQEKILFFIYRLCSFPSMYGANKAIIKLRSGIDIGQPRLPFLPVSSEDPKVVELKNDIEKAIAALD